METKKCKYCKEDIAKNAKRCPKCGGKFGLPTWAKVLIILAIIFICLVACVNGCATAVDEAFKAYDDQNGKTSFNVGETFESKYIKMKYVSSNSDFKNYSEYASVDEGYKVVQFTFDIENISKDDDDDSYTIDWTDFDCYADNKSMDRFISLLDSDTLDSITLSKGKKGTLSVYCEVPMDSKKVTVEYKYMLGDKHHEFTAQ